MTEINLISYNVKSLSNDNKRREIFHFLLRKPHNVIFLQETRSTKKTVNTWRAKAGCEVYFSHGNSNARGVMIKMLSVIFLCLMKPDCIGFIILGITMLSLVANNFAKIL